MRGTRYAVVFLALLLGLFSIFSCDVYAIVVGDSIKPEIELGSTVAVYNLQDEAQALARDRGCDFALFTVETSNSTNHTTIGLDMKGYSELSAQNKKIVMQTALEVIEKSGLNTQDRVRLYNFVCSQDETTSALVRQLSDDVKADYATAYSWFRPFSGTVSTILGVLAILIFTFLTLMILIDIAFIVLPFVRVWLCKSDGTCKWVSNEATSAMKEAETGTGDYKSPLIIYFKHKTGQIFILGICLLYLVSGKIYDFVSWVVDAINTAIG